ncbi:MAG: hypothetical protein ACT4PL_01935 [Phycisphaerales bacterium]
MQSRNRRHVLLSVSLLAVGALCICAGCTYTRVVGARGFGSERVQVEEPYQESGQLDRWIFGEDPVEKQRARQSY